MTRTQRWTLAVVCAATAMLMLDIAVVNTALSAIAADLDTGLSGLQWVVDAYTLPLAATVITAGSLADRFGRRRLFVHRPRHLHRHVPAVRGGAVDHDAQRLARRAGRGRRDHVRGLAGRALQRVPAHGGAGQGARRLRGDDGRLLRRRAAGGRRAHLRAGLAMDLPHQPPARADVPVDRPPVRRRVEGSARAARGPSRASSRSRAACSCSSSRCCAATRTGGRARRSSPPSAAPPPCCARSSPSRRASRSRCSRCACSATRRSPARRWRRSGSPRRCSRCGST